MKKISLLLVVCSLFLSSIAQDTARILVKVQDENLSPIAGQQIIFEDNAKAYTTSSASDDKGEMLVELLGGKTYNIRIKTIGDAEDYNTIEIPALPEGQQYGLNELTITIFETKTFTLDNVYFDSGKSSLKSTSFTELDELFEYMSLKKALKIEIAGHTDDVGDDEANMNLSDARAKAVKAYLVKKGIASDRVKTSAFGETTPVADNETPEGRAKNRRIEVNVL